jgi:hypothetical protein
MLYKERYSLRGDGDWQSSAGRGREGKYGCCFAVVLESLSCAGESVSGVDVEDKMERAYCTVPCLFAVISNFHPSWACLTTLYSSHFGMAPCLRQVSHRRLPGLVKNKSSEFIIEDANERRAWHSMHNVADGGQEGCTLDAPHNELDPKLDLFRSLFSAHRVCTPRLVHLIACLSNIP